MQERLVDLAVQQACVLAAQVLRARPSALATDLDGTLSPIVTRPEDAAVLPGCRHALALLRERVDLVAVISGRAVTEARSLLGLEGVVYLGNHGLDAWTGGVEGDGRAVLSGLGAVLEEIEKALPGDLGLRFEDKGATISIHYRGATDRETARSLVLAAADSAATRHGLVVAEGKMVVEVWPSDWAGKGAGLSGLVRAHGIRGLVYLGDDRSDMLAIEMLAQMRQEGGLRGLSIAVMGAESPSELGQLADVALAGPEQVEVFLEELVEALN